MAADRRSARRAARRLIEIYSRLAERREPLFASVLKGQAPSQWEHYPQADAIDAAHGFQWFYHCHSPEDRPGASEHGHVHLFARRDRLAPFARSKAEAEFSRLTHRNRRRAKTRHLLAIGFDPRGLPTQLFMVNSWVTGDLMASATTTAALLAELRLDTGFADVDGVIEAVCRLCADEIGALLAQRDRALAAHAGPHPLDDASLELLSAVDIDLDRKLAAYQ
ncbi:MAG: hypothetical protein KGM15_03555 [Pseudomonadota bacterium]|nr:hypothetical protein [Pseudomonadota bacterium]